jgi:hypothetical protein
MPCLFCFDFTQAEPDRMLTLVPFTCFTRADASHVETIKDSIPTDVFMYLKF